MQKQSPNWSGVQYHLKLIPNITMSICLIFLSTKFEKKNINIHVERVNLLYRAGHYSFLNSYKDSCKSSGLELLWAVSVSDDNVVRA